MPNHITNILTFDGSESEIKRLFETVLSRNEKDEKFLDFNKIIPMPKELEGTVSPCKIISDEEYSKEKARIESGELTDIEKNFGISIGITELMQKELIKKTGFDNWYDWRIQNWGTKWNSYDNTIEDYLFEFNTAWSAPIVVIQKLSEMFPNITIELSFADEDFGYNCGKLKFIGGEIIETNLPDGGTFDAYMLVLEVKGDDDYYLGDYLEECIDEDFGEILLDVAVAKEYVGEDYSDRPDLVSRLIKLAENSEKYEYAQKLKNCLIEDLS